MIWDTEWRKVPFRVLHAIFFLFCLLYWWIACLGCAVLFISFIYWFVPKNGRKRIELWTDNVIFPDWMTDVQDKLRAKYE